MKQSHLKMLTCLIFVLFFANCEDQPGVISGEGVFEKVLFFEAQMTMVTDILEDNVDLQPGREIVVFGQLSMFGLDRDSGTAKWFVPLHWGGGILRSEIIHMPGDKYFKIMARYSPWVVGLLDHFGKPVWIYEPSDTVVHDMAAGDLDGNGEPEFYVATGDGIRQLDSSGKEVRTIGGHIYVYDVDILNPGDTLPILASVGQTGIQLRDYEGKVVRKIRTEANITDIEAVDWPTTGHLLMQSAHDAFLVDLDGRVILEYHFDRDIFEIRGTKVRFYPDEQPYLALLAKFSSSIGQSMLCIFSPDGELVYKELLRTTTGLLAVQSHGKEVLLAGNGPGMVYKYTGRKKAR